MSKRVNYNLSNGTVGNVGIGTTSPNFKLHVEGDIFASGEVTSTSDIRFKTNIEPFNITDETLIKIKNLKSITFKKKNQENNHTHIGFIAQDLEKIVPELVYTDSITGYKSIAYGNMNAILFEYIKLLNNEIDELKENVKELNNKIDILKNN